MVAIFCNKKEARPSLRMGGLSEDPNHACYGPVSLRISSPFLVSETPETSPLTGNPIFVPEFLFFTHPPKHNSTIDEDNFCGLIIINISYD
jgi:hypothetical protein